MPETYEELEEPPTPAQETPQLPKEEEFYPQYSQEPISGTEERIQEVAETIIDEKWSNLIDKLSEFNSWRERATTEIVSIKQEVLRTQERFENLQRAVLGQVRDYNKSITDINTEMKALEKVFQKILEPLTSNIKELGRITQELKKKT